MKIILHILLILPTGKATKIVPVPLKVLDDVDFVFEAHYWESLTWSSI